MSTNPVTCTEMGQTTYLLHPANHRFLYLSQASKSLDCIPGSLLLCPASAITWKLASGSA